LNTYLEDKIFTDEAEEVKLGYLNINGLKYKVEDIDADKNLLNLDCLILAETKLSPEMEVNLENWNISRTQTQNLHIWEWLFFPKRTQSLV
jgi:hypothetical protein